MAQPFVERCANGALRRAARRRFVSERDLGLDDRVQRGVQRYVRHANTRAAVIIPRKVNALLLTQRRVGRLKGIVAPHGLYPRQEFEKRGLLR